MINFKHQHKLQLHYPKTSYTINISVAPKCLPVVYKVTVTNICHVSLVLSSLKGESICSEVFCFGRKLKEKKKTNQTCTQLHVSLRGTKTKEMYFTHGTV